MRHERFMFDSMDHCHRAFQLPKTFKYFLDRAVRILLTLSRQREYFCHRDMASQSKQPGIKIPEIAVSLTAEEKLDITWKYITENEAYSKKNKEAHGTRKWPSYNDSLQDIRKSDYTEIVTCPLDIHPGKPQEPKYMRLGIQALQLAPSQPTKICPNKKLCAQGVVCTAKLELFDFPEEGMKGRPYSGLLKPGTTVENCLVRLSSALQPVDMGGNQQKVARLMFGEKLSNAKIFPSVAIKMFRSNQHSGNALFLGSKVGQREDEFFSHCLSTQLTSKMPPTLRPIVHMFKKYSQFPLSLGLSDLCSYDADGNMAEDLNFPFCLTLHPRVRTIINFGRARLGVEEDDKAKSPDAFLDQFKQVGKGATLYDVYASPDPLSVANPFKLQRIGRLVATSSMKASPHDDGLFFRHQKKDEDFALRPQWKDQLNTKVALKGGESGTVAALTGWKVFEQQIQAGKYVDFEKK